MDTVPEMSSHMLIVGCGNMGGAMLRGWIAAGRSPSLFTVIDPAAQDLPVGVRHVPSAGALDEIFDTVLIGIKPQMLDSRTCNSGANCPGRAGAIDFSGYDD